VANSLPFRKRTLTGHPVDVASGVVFTAWADFFIPGIVPLEWRRLYSTAYLEDGPFGKGWVTRCSVRLRYLDNRIVFLNEDASGIPLKVPADGERINHPGLQYETIREGMRYIINHWHHAQRYIFDIIEENKTFRLVRVETAVGHGVDLLYTDGRWTGIRDSAGREYGLQYNARGLVESISLLPEADDEKPVLLVRYQYDAQDRLIAVYDRMGQPMRYAYDKQHRLIKETNRLGGSFHFEYDSQGRCVHSYGDEGYTERHLRYDEEEKITEVTDGHGAVTKYELSDFGMVMAVTDPLGNTSRKVYDLEGRMTIDVDAAGGMTTYAYGPEGDRVQIEDPAGGAHQYEFDSLHRLTKVVDPKGNEWQWEFDERGLLASEQNPSGDVWKYQYDDRMLLASAEDPAGAVWTLEHDRWANLTRLVRPLGGTSSYKCDRLGRFLEEREPSGRIRRWTYNERGDILSETREDGTERRQSFDAGGNVTMVREPRGGTFRIEYDRFGQIVEEREAEGGVVRYTYDKEGRTTSITNQNGERATFEYDAAGRLIRETGFDGAERKLTYGARGEVTAITEADGREFTFEFDARRLLQKMIGPEQVITYERDELGRVIKATSGDHVIEQDFDPMGLPSRVVSGEFETSYKYENGRRVSADFADGYHVEYEYDLEGRLVSLQAPGQTHAFEWDAAGRMTQHRRASGLTSHFHWSPGYQMYSHSMMRSDGSELLRQQYEYDEDGGLTQVRDSRLGDFSFEHDMEGRALKAAYPGEKETFSYDGAGNIRSRSAVGSAAHDPGNRLRSMGETRYRVDAAGKTTRMERGSDWIDLKYDDFARLVQSQDNHGTTVQYAYDALGRRIRKDAGEVHDYVWDLNRIAEDRNGGTVTHYLYFPDSDEPISVDVNGEIHDLITDPTGFPSHVLNLKGDLVWSGWRRLWGDGMHGSGDSPHNLGFVGQFLDPETGFYYNYARYYSAEAGRYLTPDPIGFIGGLNVYSYVPNPLTYIDPLGLRCTGVYEDEETQRMRIMMPKGNDTVHGAKRDSKLFWRNYSAKDARVNRTQRHLSEDNQQLIRDGRSPVVDEQWIASHPMDAPYEGQTLVHHHEHQRRRTVGIPDGLHRSNHGTLHPDRR
jgi:RHS repeat-associated protein